MAIVDTDTVLPVNLAGSNFQHGSDFPVFGIVTNIGAGTVQWRNGEQSTVPATASLDKIVDPLNPKFKVTDWVRPVAGGADVAQRNEGPVVAVFRRDNDGGDNPGPNRVVVLAEALGLYYETNEDNVELVASR